jgi:phosphoribosylformylglycinamidine (FGAM) synthase-like amidotransferase family enzyme
MSRGPFGEETVMAGELEGRSIAVLATDGVEQVELTEPVKALKKAGARVAVVSDKKGQIQAFKHHDKASKVPVDTPLDSANPDDFDGLVLPGGVINPDALRLVLLRSSSFGISFMRKSRLRQSAMGRGRLLTPAVSVARR